MSAPTAQAVSVLIAPTCKHVYSTAEQPRSTRYPFAGRELRFEDEGLCPNCFDVMGLKGLRAREQELEDLRSGECACLYCGGAGGNHLATCSRSREAHMASAEDAKNVILSE